MAKPVGTLKQAIAQANALSKQMAGERAADYQVASGALNVGAINLAKQTQGITRNLVMSQKQNRAAVAALNAKGLAQSGIVAGQAAATRNMYGSGLGKAVAQAYSGAKATAGATAAKTEGGVKLSGAAARTAGLVAGIASQGVVATKAAAAYALNQALQQRTLVDNQTIANLEGNLYQTAIQANEQIKVYRKEQSIAQKQAAKTQNEAAATALTNEIPDLAVQAYHLYSTSYDPSKGSDAINIGKLVADWATSKGYSPTGPEAAVMTAALQKYAANGAPGQTQPQAAMVYAVQNVYGGQPGFNDWGQPVLNAISAGTSVAFTQAYDTPGGAYYVAPVTPDQIQPTTPGSLGGNPNSTYIPSGPTGTAPTYYPQNTGLTG